jgi:polyhydroxybutyrate depolymerase
MRGSTGLKCLGGCLVGILAVACLSACSIVGVGIYYRHRLNQYPVESKAVQVDFDGHERSYRIYVPENLAEPAPLVFVIHGGGGDATGMEQMTKTRFNELADRDGFIVVYPQGIDNQWSDGRADDFRPESHQAGVDDVGYFNFMIDDVAADYDVDEDHIFATGISNGGFMSMRLACELSDRIAGVGIVTAQMSVDLGKTCQPSEPVKVLMMNGTDDPLVPYEGGHVEVFRRKRGAIWSVDETVDFWVAQNGCDEVPLSERLPDEEDDGMRVERRDYAGCVAGGEVVLYRVEGGGHTWPGGVQYLPSLIVGKATQDMSGADEIWAFWMGE